MSKLVSTNSDFFLACLKKSVEATLDATMGEGIIVAILARASCGIYGGTAQKLDPGLL